MFNVSLSTMADLLYTALFPWCAFSFHSHQFSLSESYWTSCTEDQYSLKNSTILDPGTASLMKQIDSTASEQPTPMMSSGQTEAPHLRIWSHLYVTYFQDFAANRYVSTMKWGYGGRNHLRCTNFSVVATLEDHHCPWIHTGGHIENFLRPTILRWSDYWLYGDILA